jgi:hypothetical protein
VCRRRPRASLKRVAPPFLSWRQLGALPNGKAPFRRTARLVIQIIDYRARVFRCRQLPNIFNSKWSIFACNCGGLARTGGSVFERDLTGLRSPADISTVLARSARTVAFPFS